MTELSISGDGCELSDLSVIVVAYNSAEVLSGCIASIPASVEVIVVDNASADSSAAVARRATGTKVVALGENRGFGGGCNAGLNVATRRFVMFLNPDARVSEGALLQVEARLREFPLAAVGPAIVDDKGEVNPLRRPYRYWRAVLQYLPAGDRYRPSACSIYYDVSDRLYRVGGEVPTLHGSCFAAARDDLIRIGGFDEDLFLYGEEESIARRLRAVGGTLYYDPQAEILHIGGTSTSKTGHFATAEMFRSRAINARKAEGRLVGVLKCGLVYLGLMLGLPTAVANTMLTRRSRVVNWSWWRAAVRGLWSGLRADIESGSARRYDLVGK